MPQKIHKVFTQTGKTLVVVIPHDFARELDIKDGTYVRIVKGNDGKLTISKIEEAST